MLPRLNELRRLPQILYLVTLTIGHTARQGVRGVPAQKPPGGGEMVIFRLL